MLAPDEMFGYPVDSSTGCFMDVDAARALSGAPFDYERYFEALRRDMEKRYVHTWDWGSVVPASDSGANVVAFTTGFGDGYYASYWGFDAGGAVVALVTDFDVLPPATP